MTPFPNITLPNVAVTGDMGAGKSSVADFLCYTAGYQRIAFADSLRDVAALLYGEEARNDRTILQQLGPGLRQTMGQNVWADAWFRAYTGKHARANAIPVPYRVVVDDCRYENEVGMLRGLGFTFVHVTADRNRRVARLQANGKLTDESQLDHESERALPADYTPDFVVENTGSWEELEATVFHILNRKRS